MQDFTESIVFMGELQALVRKCDESDGTGTLALAVGRGGRAVS